MNLIVKAKTQTKKEIILKNPISLEYKSNRFIPCDSLDVTFLMQYEYEDFFEISAFLNNVLFFEGIVDKQVLQYSNKGYLITLSCRNKTALLVDNEVKPYMYFQLSASELFKRYALSYGVLSYEFPYEAKKNFLEVKKGMSNWNVIEEFCEQVYNKKPYINKEKKLVLSPLTSKTFIFSNNITNSIAFCEMKIQKINYKLISKLFLKTATENYGYYYGVVIDNENALRKHVKRERYYHPNSKISTNAKKEAEKIIKDSNRNSFIIEITTPSLLDINIGDNVIVNDSLVKHDNLAVIDLNYIINQNGMKTIINLCEKKYL